MSAVRAPSQGASGDHPQGGPLGVRRESHGDGDSGCNRREMRWIQARVTAGCRAMGGRVADVAVKYVFVTGGVVSGLGKGISAASLGTLLKARGVRVSLQKCDPYLNVDPGTMNPFQHGEVYVTEDGAETRPRLGHYERYTREPSARSPNVTTGAGVRHRDQEGAPRRFLGATVQVIPHVTDEIKARIRQAAATSNSRGRHRRDRRHGRRHRVAAVPRGDPPAAQRRGTRERLLRARHAGALPRCRWRAEDQDHPALGERIAGHRHRARHPRPAVRPRPHDESARKMPCTAVSRARRSSRPWTPATSTRCR